MLFLSVARSVANKASNMITSFDVVYKIDDETPITINLRYNIANGEDISFSIDDFSVSENKAYTFNAEVINLNGSGVDISPEDNVATISFGSYETALPRNVLMEQFTTESCGYCPGFAATLKAFLEEKGHPENLILQAHHSGFYTDNFTTTEDKAYMWFFGGATWAPAIMFDRTNFDTSTPGPVTYAGDLEKWTSMALDVPAFVSLDIDGSYNSATKTVTVKVKGEKVRETLPGESDVRMNVYLQESEVAAINQSNGGKGYKHAAVMRASLTGTWGEKITLPVGEFETKEYTYTIPSSWNADNMKVVAFVSNYTSADHNDSPVYNAKAVSFPVDNAMSKVEFATNQLYVTDSKLHINTEYKNGRILNAMGAIVMEFNNGNIIDLNALNEGIYIVNVDKGSKQISSKVVIKH